MQSAKSDNHSDSVEQQRQEAELEIHQLRQTVGAMRERIAALLSLPVDAVNVKAKTAEKMGPVGEGLAIEARAVCLLCQREPDVG